MSSLSLLDLLLKCEQILHLEGTQDSPRQQRQLEYPSQCRKELWQAWQDFMLGVLGITCTQVSRSRPEKNEVPNWAKEEVMGNSSYPQKEKKTVLKNKNKDNNKKENKILSQRYSKLHS